MAAPALARAHSRLRLFSSRARTDAALLRALQMALHPDAVHGHTEAEAANAAAFAALQEYVRPRAHGGDHAAAPVRLRAYLPGPARGAAPTAVDVLLPPPGSAPPAVALLPLLRAAGLVPGVDYGDPKAPPAQPSEAEVAATLAERRPARFLPAARALALARAASARADVGTARIRAAMRIVHGLAPGLHGGASPSPSLRRLADALAAVPPGALRGAPVMLTADPGVATGVGGGGAVWLAAADGDAAWRDALTAATDPDTGWRAVAGLEAGAAAALGVGGVAQGAGVGAASFRALLAGLAALPPAPDPELGVTVRFVATLSTAAPPAGVVCVACGGSPTTVAAAVSALRAAAAAAAADAAAIASSIDRILADAGAKLGADEAPGADPALPPEAAARGAAALAAAAQAVRAESGAWGGRVRLRLGPVNAVAADGSVVVWGVGA